jgi:predicted phosphate transport protein (TIGR00153 family)
MAFSLLPREDEYFAFFSQMSAKIQDAAQLLVQMVGEERSKFESYYAKIKKTENACDELTHKITTKLNRSFVTPFDREDIYELSVALDDVCDYIDAAARAIVIYDIRDLTVHARDLAEIIYRLAVQIHGSVSILNKPNGMNQYIVEIHRLENEADDVYFRAIGELFRNESDPISLIKLKELYEILENATDRCESVANIIESVVLKHS